MNDLQIRQDNLPVQPEELARFILVGEEKAKAIKAEIRAIQKLHLANDVWHQKQEELEMVREAVIEAERRIGVLFNNMPKASGGDRRSEDFKSAEVAPLKTRKEAAEELGFKHREVQRFQQMAKHPEAIEQAKAEAKENGTDLTTQSVLNKIRQQDKPVDLRQYAEAKADEKYYQEIEDERLHTQLRKAVDAVNELPGDPASWEAMRRYDQTSLDTSALTLQTIINAITRLRGIKETYMKGGSET